MDTQIIVALIGAAGLVVAALIRTIPDIMKLQSNAPNASAGPRRNAMPFFIAILVCVSLCVAGIFLYPAYQPPAEQQWERETLSAGKYHTVGLRTDGAVVAVGDNNYGQCDVSDWRDIQLP